MGGGDVESVVYAKRTGSCYRTFTVFTLNPFAEGFRTHRHELRHIQP